MIYKELGNTGIKISAISFGSMRWPGEQECSRIINRGLDAGMNYVDTSTGYVGGKSQIWTGAAIEGRRDQIYVSSKYGFDKAPDAEEIRRRIEENLTAMGLDYFDFWQLWGLQRAEALKEATAKGGFIEGVRKAQEEGLIRHGIGFPFHGPPEVFKAAVDTGEFVSATVSYNLLKRKEEELIEYAGSRGVGIIIMNPMAGGVLGLARTTALDFLCGNGAGPSYGALRFLFANSNITAAIVGFRATEEVEESLLSLEGAGELDEPIRRDLMQKMDDVKLLTGDFCTGCGYCKECPNGFNPTRFMKVMRDFTVYGVEPGRLKNWIYSQYPHSNIVEDIQKCTECGECEQKCPQHLKIIENIRKARKALGVG